jgi:hypothetical protein
MPGLGVCKLSFPFSDLDVTCVGLMNSKYDSLSLLFLRSLVSFLLSLMVSKPEGNRPVARRNYRWGDKVNNTCSVRINVTWRGVRFTIVAVEKQYVVHILSVCLALVTQNAMRMRLIEFSSVTCPVVPYFSTSHKRQNFRRKFTEHKMCFVILSTTSC